MAPTMEFQPRWKEELVCTSPAGTFVLEMPMGIVSVYFPPKEAWATRAPEWAAPYWQEIHQQLSAWCLAANIPLHLDDSAKVWEETRPAVLHADAANARGCYCDLWDSKPEVLRDQGLPEGFCGHCEKCGAPGHARHFPGPVPYTGAWCDKHYRRLKLVDPRTVTGCLPWIVLAISIFVIVRLTRG